MRELDHEDGRDGPPKIGAIQPARRLYGERLAGCREMPSRCALLQMAAGGRRSFKLTTPVGVLCFASFRRFFTSSRVQGSPDRCVYLGWALRGPRRPIASPAASRWRWHVVVSAKTDE